MFNLEGKNAFISGASRGLGRQFANALAKAGANVVITSRTLESLETTKQEIEAIGRKCINIEMEVLEEDSIINAVKKAETELGPIFEQTWVYLRLFEAILGNLEAILGTSSK